MGTCDQGTVEEILDFFYEQVCVCFSQAHFVRITWMGVICSGKANILPREVRLEYCLRIHPGLATLTKWQTRQLY